LAILQGHTGRVTSVTFSPDSNTLASSDDHSVKIRDTNQWQEVGTLARHSKPVTSVAFFSDGKTLASASYDMTVRIWDTETRQESRVPVKNEICN
jgi:WD40 repeat protein